MNSLKYGDEGMEYLSISQTAEKWGLSKRRVQVLCSENRILGVMRVGSYLNDWIIPSFEAVSL